MNAALQDGLHDHLLESQIQLMREYWSSVRHLWLGMSNLTPPGELLGGLPGDFWTGVGMPGLGTVTKSVGRFEFSDNGEPAIILPCFNTIPGNVVASARGHVEHLVDLVAVNVEQHDHFARRRGDALVLGNAYLEIAAQEGAPVPVFRNPLSWFQAGGDGVVVLDWEYARELLTGLDLIAENLALGEQLEAALKPDIWITA